MRIISKCILLALVASLATPWTVVADYIAPGEVVVKTTTYTPFYRELPDGILEYSISWQGLPVGSASIRVVKEYEGDNQLFHVQADARTASAIDLLYQLRHRSEGYFSVGTYKPSSFLFRQTENSKKRVTQVAFEPNGIIKSKRWKNDKEEANFEFQSSNPTMDPLSAAFLARSLPIEVGKTASFDVFNGKNRYLIGFSIVGLEKMKRGGELVDAFKVIPTVKKLTDTKDDKRLKSAAIWISTDARRDILRLESKVWFGKVVAELDRMSPLPARVSPVIRAKLQESEPQAQATVN